MSTRTRKTISRATTNQPRVVAGGDAEAFRLAEALAGVGRWSFDFTTREVVWSDEVYRVHGVTRETFSPSGRASVDAYHPDDRATVSALIARAEQTGEGYDSKLRLRRLSDGEDRIVRARAKVELGPDGRPSVLFGVFQDVTDQELALRRIAESEANYRLLADLSTDVILRIGPNGLIRYCSPAARKWGYEPEEIVGTSTLTLVHPDDLENAIATLTDCFADGPMNLTLRREYRVRRKDGGYVWLEGNPSAVKDETGKTIEIVTAYRDVTARREAEEALAQARDAAEAAVQAKSDFLANMSHELRTPLTSVIGFAGLLRETPMPEDAARYVRRIASASTALLGLINDVLDFSKLEAGRLALDPHPTDVSALADEVCDLLSVQASAKGLALAADVDPAVAALVDIDDLRLRQILNNLVGNAVKFTVRGKVTLRIRVEEQETRRMRIEVQDTGPGLTSEEAGRLFRRFSQADASISRKHGGSGLGLSICQELTQMMGGDIGVESKPNQGSTFWVELPAPLSHANAPTAPPAMNEEAAAVSGGRVLIADDHPANRELVRALLSGLDLSLSEASNGLEAVQACLVEPFDLILMDMQMPGMDGLTATRGIRASSELNARTPVIALTAMGYGADDPVLRAAGMDDMLAKPIDPAQLVTKVTRWLDAGPRSATRKIAHG